MLSCDIQETIIYFILFSFNFLEKELLYDRMLVWSYITTSSSIHPEIKIKNYYMKEYFNYPTKQKGFYIHMMKVGMSLSVVCVCVLHRDN